MQIRKVKHEDIDLLVENRVEFVTTIRTIENIEEFKKYTKEYLEKHIEDGSIISYIAIDNSKIVSSAILCIYETLPIPSCLNGKIGLLLNVYTIKEYRRKGLAKKILNKVIEEAKLSEIGKIQLDYTDDGYPVYKKLGFEELDRQMILKLN